MLQTFSRYESIATTQEEGARRRWESEKSTLKEKEGKLDPAGLWQRGVTPTPPQPFFQVPIPLATASRNPDGPARAKSNSQILVFSWRRKPYHQEVS